MAKILIWIGIGLIVAGLLLNYFPQLFSWFGKLPGDIFIKNEHSVIFIPITSMIVISIVLSFIIHLINRL
ncbi:DUF2905 domain-containing protein [Galenea microaerophila]